MQNHNGNLPGLSGPVAELRFECIIGVDHSVRVVVTGANSKEHAVRLAEWMTRSLQRHGPEIGIVAHEDFDNRLVLPRGVKPRQ